MFQLVAEKITQERHLEYQEITCGTRTHILLYGTLVGLIISKVFEI